MRQVDESRLKSQAFCNSEPLRRKECWKYFSLALKRIEPEFFKIAILKPECARCYKDKKDCITKLGC